jgi:hypothetical protein
MELNGLFNVRHVTPVRESVSKADSEVVERL